MEKSHLTIVFRTRLRAEVLGDAALAGELDALGGRMYEIASGMAGFMSYKDFAAADGECVSIVEFEDAESLAAWRNHPEHLQAQREGRERFFESYHIQVCVVQREYSRQCLGSE